MPALLHGSEYYDALTDDLIEAWGLEELETIFYGSITQDTAGRPYGIIALGSVPMEYVGVRTIEQTYEFQVAYYARQEERADFNLELVKEQKANAMLTRLENGALYNQTGLAPIVTSVVFDTLDYDDELWYVVALSFQVLRHEAG